MARDQAAALSAVALFAVERDPEDEARAEPAAVVEGMPTDVAHPQAVDRWLRHSSLLSDHVYTRCHSGIG